MNKLTVIDLFSGPGGFSEGFKQTGYSVQVAIDYDKNSIDTYQSNNPDVSAINDDISEVHPEEILSKSNHNDIDVVIGGPPCQGFSIAGNRDKNDKRNKLFLEFANYIDYIQPSVFVMENVPGLLSMETPEGKPVIDEIQNKFKSIGYTTSYKTLTASDYGTPQSRKRVFIIGTKADTDITFPDPTHSSEDSTDLQSYITVSDALSDLPSLDAGESTTSYTKPSQNQFQEHMRSDVSERDSLLNHDAVNHRSHIVERFKHIPQGGDMTDAPEEHQPSKVYSSRNRRLQEDKPSHTVTSHVLDELIHLWDDRALTVREAARLQCFPDRYEFKGKRNVFHGSDETSQYEQVGNAVPVALSRSIAEHIKDRYF